MMLRVVALGALALGLTACGGNRGVFADRGAPDEFAISRQAPLVVPPDYGLAPPRPGAPRPLAADSQQQAVEALFGPGVAPPPKSASEQQLLDKAGATKADPTARSTVGDPATTVVDKGAMVRDILAAPPGAPTPAVAQVSTGV